ncbi:(d)CMP kinase [Odoribacter sp. OttesenSCG-928-J03]|nr:(d)CMP kinase [Odoribacter sp. OttesenSCG-928-J03]
MKNSDPKGLIIAIDGHSSTGKSTVAKILAARLNYTYIDTGAMYRAVTLFALRNNCLDAGKIDEESLIRKLHTISLDFKYNTDKGIYETYMNGEKVEEEIRGMDVANYVSAVSSIAAVREYLVEKQREMGKKGGVVMDGRDIGSVVFPHAEVKFFLTSRPEVRAKRRYEELKAKGVVVSYEEVEENIRSRDYQDENRAVSPLKRVEDAILVDNSEMTIEEEVEKMCRIIEGQL